MHPTPAGRSSRGGRTTASPGCSATAVCGTSPSSPTTASPPGAGARRPAGAATPSCPCAAGEPVEVAGVCVIPDDYVYVDGSGGVVIPAADAQQVFDEAVRV